MARFLQLGPKENVVTVATDGFDRYPSVLADLEKRVGPITDTTLARWSEEVFRNSQDTRDILDTRPLRQKERLFRCKEELWTQFGYSLAYLDRMKSAGFWEEEREKINVVDAQLLQSRN
jgi:hypothetical protein